MTNRIVLGRLPNNSMGLQVSRPGTDVLSNINHEDYLLNSEYSKLQMLNRNVMTYPEGYPHLKTIPHGFSYRPIVSWNLIVWQNVNGEWQPRDQSGLISFQVYVDMSNIYFEATNDGLKDPKPADGNYSGFPAYWEVYWQLFREGMI